MSVKLITYDLNKENTKHDYSGLYKYIKSQDYVKFSESSYAVDNNSTVQAIYNALKPHLDTNDYIVVIYLKRPYAGYHQKSVWAWLNERLE